MHGQDGDTAVKAGFQRQSIASLNLVLSSNVWQQDHNGYTHQDLGFLDHIANKKADVVRLYLPQLGNKGAYLIQKMKDKLVEHKQYIHEVGQDLPEIRDWKWGK